MTFCPSKMNEQPGFAFKPGLPLYLLLDMSWETSRLWEPTMVVRLLHLMMKEESAVLCLRGFIAPCPFVVRFHANNLFNVHNPLFFP